MSRPSATAIPPASVVRVSSATIAAAASIAGLAAALALRLAIIYRYRIDSDETQHLHVVWGWWRGLLPYRDVFDNHMPLFHVLAVPLLWLTGEQPDALILARLVMLPLFAVVALLAYRIGTSCYPRRAVIVATIIGCFAPDFFLCSVEFRPDVLWAIFWLTALAILVTAPLTPGRAAMAGLALGLAACVSAKTSLLAAVLGIAAAVALVLTRDISSSWRGVSKNALSFAAGAAVPLLLIVAYFVARGAWRPFLYCTIKHNVVVSDHPERLLLIPLFAAILVWSTRRILRDDAVPAGVRRRRLFLLLASYGYAAAMISMWPIIETEHWLPFYPVAAIATIGLLPRNERTVSTLVVLIFAFELLGIVRTSTPWRNEVTPATTLVEQTLKLTGPNDTVFDLKGEMVFRRRAFRYELEKITKRAISKGRLQDTIAVDMLRMKTMVAVRDNEGIPPRSRAFLLRNFVNAGCLRVAGMILRRDRTVRIEVPGEYSIVAAHGEFHGLLDGSRYTGSRFLGTGVHTAGPVDQPAALLWTRAAALGFSPFAEDLRCGYVTASGGESSTIARSSR